MKMRETKATGTVGLTPEHRKILGWIAKRGASGLAEDSIGRLVNKELEWEGHETDMIWDLVEWGLVTNHLPSKMGSRDELEVPLVYRITPKGTQWVNL